MTNTTDIVLLQRDIADLKEIVRKQEAEIEKLKDLDTKRMRAALIGLGTIVFSMATYIWVRVVEGR